MRHTPEIPVRFKRFVHPGYTNVFSFLPDCKRFYCTETLFGDWNAQTLILAKDAAPTSAIKSRVRLEGDVAWRHSEREKGDSGGWKTNERVVEIAKKLPGNKLYGSAMANLLCNAETWSPRLIGFRRGNLHDYLCDVLQWVICSMPNLQAIACTGNEAWLLATTVLGRKDLRTSIEYRNEQLLLVESIDGRRIAASFHYHPAARVSNGRIELGWSNLAHYLRSRSLSQMGGNAAA